MMPARVLAAAMLSLPHLIIIFVVALVVFGPEKLPELARTLGRFLADFRRLSGEVRGSLEENLRELEREATGRRQAVAAPMAPAASADDGSRLEATESSPADPAQTTHENPADGNA